MNTLTTNTTSVIPQVDSCSVANTFANRIKLLIEEEGSATAIARKCNFSEGVIRSWRDGHTDPSRGRCVILAKALGISLLWLVTGEGPIRVKKTDDLSSVMEDHPHLALADTHQSVAKHGYQVMDAGRLTAAMQILQSMFGLANSPLTLADHTDLLTELYQALAPYSLHKDLASLVDFHHHMTARIQQTKAPQLSKT